MNQFIPGSGRLAPFGAHLRDNPMTRKSAGLTYLPMTTKAVDESQGEVVAAINSLGVEDLQQDIVEPGAWSGIINEMKAGRTKWPSVLLNHDWSQIAGKVVYAVEQDNALVATLKFNLATAVGKDTFSNLKFGALNEFSVGFMPGDDYYANDSTGHTVHHIKSVSRWPEVSCVLVGASPGTRTLAIKSSPTYDDLKERLASMVMDRLGRRDTPQPYTEVPRPLDQPFESELNDPVRARAWEWVEAEGRYRRRRHDSPVDVASAARIRGPQDESKEQTLERWARGGYGAFQQQPK